jgi:cytochrome P450
MKMLPPGPKPLIPGANLRAMQRDAIRFLRHNAATYGDVSAWRFGPQPVWLVNHPDLIREVLVVRDRSFMKGRALQRTKLLLGEGLLTSEGDLHRRQRRLAQPAFHHQRIARYAEAMVEEAARLTARWRDGEERDLHHEMMRVTLAVVARTLFGTSVEHEADEIGAALTELMEMFPLLLNPFSEILRRLPLPRVRRFRWAIERLDRTIYSIIAARRAEGGDRGDLLSMLLLAQDQEEGSGGMSDQQVRDEVMTLFLAGHETTANALTWTWHLLAQQPEAERELHAELDALGRAPEPRDAQRLPFTEMVLAESMRLYPPAWAIGRLALEDVPLGGWTLPRGAVAIVSQAVTHRDPRWWPEPERFDPRRFTAEAKASRPKFAYFPFGGGSRICIGEGFAWTEGVLILATIAREWRLRSTPHPVVPQALITLRPKGEVRMRIERR